MVEGPIRGPSSTLFDMFINSEAVTRARRVFERTEVRPELIAVMSDLGDRLTRHLQRVTPVASGRLRNRTGYNLKLDIVSGEVLVTLEIVQRARRRAYGGGLVAYRPFVTNPTPPHMPQVQPLIEWVQNVLGYREQKARSVGWAIARSIERRGTLGNRYDIIALNHSRFDIERASEDLGIRLTAQLADSIGG